MKVGYRKPAVEFEDYELNTTIASGCKETVNLGPGDPVTGYVCDEYKIQISSLEDENSLSENFYEGSCLCYLTAGTGALFTS